MSTKLLENDWVRPVFPPDPSGELGVMEPLGLKVAEFWSDTRGLSICCGTDSVVGEIRPVIREGDDDDDRAREI